MRLSIVWSIFSVVASCLLVGGRALQNFTFRRSSATILEIPKRGVLRTPSESLLIVNTDKMPIMFKLPQHSRFGKLWTSFRLWSQVPWRRITGQRVLRIKLSGSLSLAPSVPLPWISKLIMRDSTGDDEKVDSLSDLSRLLMVAAHDPRIVGLSIEVGELTCGYGTLTEVLRLIEFFRASNKTIIGYADTVSEKELYLSVAFDEFYMPPEGEVRLSGFSSSALFFKDILDKIGVAPQVQRIGAYKSFGDQFSRSDLSEQQREVISCVLTQVSEHWAHSVAGETNQSLESVRQIWAEEGLLTPIDLQRRGLLTGVKYPDEVQSRLAQYYHAHPSTRPLWKHLGKSLANKILDVFAKHNTTGERESETYEDIMRGVLELTRGLSREAVRDLDLQLEFLVQPRRGAPLVSSLNDVMDQVWSILGNQSDLVIGITSSTNTTNTTYTYNASADTINTTDTANITNNTIHTTDTADTNTTDTTNTTDSTSTSDTTNTETTSNNTNDSKTAHAILFIDNLRTALRQKPLRASQSIGAHSYLKKMRHPHIDQLLAPPIQQASEGPRTAVIHISGEIDRDLSTKLTAELRLARLDPDVKAVVLRINSPGGVALQSDLLWREIRLVSRAKPVVASMVDVAASGGYYLGMACDAIVAEELTLTGSIGVVAAAFSLEGLLNKIGLKSETISIGRYAEEFNAARRFTPEEEAHFATRARHAYDSFVAKAAASRSMTSEAMEEVAQGRVWTGRQALSRGLVDHRGGLWKALEVAEQLRPTDKLDISGTPSAATADTPTDSTNTTSNSTGAQRATLPSKVYKVQLFDDCPHARSGWSVFGSPSVISSSFIRGIQGGKGVAALARLFHVILRVVLGYVGGVPLQEKNRAPQLMCDAALLSSGIVG